MENQCLPRKKVALFSLPGHNHVTLERVLNNNNMVVTQRKIFANSKEGLVMVYLEWDEYDNDLYSADLSPMVHHMEAFDVASQHNEISQILSDANISVLSQKAFPCPKEGTVLLFVEWLDKESHDDIIVEESDDVTDRF